MGWVLRAINEISENVIKILGKSLLSYEELETVLLKIELVINGCPLAYLSEDHSGDLLTPNYLMYGNAVVPESIVQDFSKRYKYISKLVNDQRT